MKKLLIILIAIPLIFNSCKKEDDSPNNGSSNNGGGNNGGTSGSVVGTWKLMAATWQHVMGYIDPVNGGEVETFSEIGSGPDPGEDTYWVYTDNGEFSYYRYLNDTLYDEIHLDYEKNGDEIELEDNYGSDVLTQTVTLLTSNNFNWSYEVESEWSNYDTTFFERTDADYQMIKSTLPSITIEPLNKKKAVSGYNLFFNQKNR